MTGILIAQLGVPVLLLAWLVVAAPRSRLGLATQLTASLVILVAVSRVGMWVFPPWWTPYAAGMLLGAAATWMLRRRPRPPVPSGALPWVVFGLCGVAGVSAAMVAHRAFAAARPPAVGVVDLAFPMGAGRFLVVNGGNALMINAHQASRDTTIRRLRPWRGNAYAVDIVAIDALGIRAPGVLPKDPAMYRIFGMPVLAPCTGTVVVAVDGRRDMPVPEYDRANMAGNHVILECAGVHVVMAHFRQGSVRVRPGDGLAVGDTIAPAGNSGGTSEPHLHIHAQLTGTPHAPMSGDPLPMRLEGRYLVRGDRVSIAPTARKGQ